MWRVLILFLALAAVAAAAAWLADHPGRIAFEWQGLRIETSAAVGGAIALLLLVAVLALYRGWRWLQEGPGAWRRKRQLGRQRRGYEALTRGLVAVAAGDAGQGHKLARRADHLLQGAPLTRLLAAQAAQLDGDETAARRHFEALKADPETEFLGVRGLLVLAKRAGERERALDLAKTAFRLRPDAAWAADELYRAQAAEADWDGALATVERAARSQRGKQAETERRRAIALYGQALAAEAAGEARRALERALKAVARAPELIPANVLAVRLYTAAGEARRARRLLAEAWRRTPHPELAAVLAESGTDETAGERLQAAERLAALNAEHLESRILLASCAIEAADWAKARGALAAADHDNPRVCRLEARLAERAEQDQAAARRWLERAATAPADSAWLCSACGWQNRQWQPVCPQCGDLDSLIWGRPAGEAAAPALLESRRDENAQEAEIAPPAELLQMDQAEEAAGNNR